MILEAKNRIEGTFTAPKSKSISIRAAFAAFLVKQEVRIKEYPVNRDSLNALDIIRQLGGNVKWDIQDVIIKGDGIIFPTEINCGESALCLNIVAALALQKHPTVTLTGENTLITRDIRPILINLLQNDIIFEASDVHLPLTIHPSPLTYLYDVDGSLSSQFATGLLIAAIYNPDILFQISDKLVSQSYFEITQSVLNDFGLQTVLFSKLYRLVNIAEPPEVYEIEGDYSCAANLLVAAAISGEITMLGINPDSRQSDRVILDILKRVGADVDISDNKIIVRSNELHSFEQAIDDCPDLFPILCVLGAYAKGVSTISGIERLKHKETNRALVMMEECKKADIDIRLDGNSAVITGGKTKGADFSSHNDHRIAMALTVYSLFAKSKSSLSKPECVKKSYPNFFDHLHKIETK